MSAYKSNNNGVREVFVARSGFKITNHKIYWESGFAKKKIEIYVGDDKTLEETIETKETPGAYTYGEAAEEKNYTGKDGKVYVLNEEESGWEDCTKGEGTSKDVEAGETATFKAYYELIANTEALEAAITKAEAEAARAKSSLAYEEESVTALEAKITSANAVLTQYKDKDKEALKDPAAIEAVDKATASISEEAIKETLKAKTLDAMASVLGARYNMDKAAEDGKVKDDSGNGHDGTVHGGVTFDRDNGAVMPGSTKALTNYIELPDDIEITDQMTFSFWVYRPSGINNQHNTFGISTGEKCARTGNVSEFSIYAGRGGNLESEMGKSTEKLNLWENVRTVLVPGFTEGQWHHVVCVMNGSESELYDNGKLVGSGNIGGTDALTLTTIWNANEGAKRHIYLGNNVYGHNGDRDYKGSLKYFRIYNASLAPEQISAIYKEESAIPITNAVADAAKAVGAKAGEDGKYTYAESSKEEEIDLNLPESGSQKEKIVWKAYAEDGQTESSAVIDVARKKAKLPTNIGDVAKAVLKGTVTLGEDTATVEIACEFTKIDPDLDLTGLDASIRKARSLRESDYTSSSWKAFQAILTEASALYAKPTSQEAVTAMKEKLDAAMKTDGTGTLAPIGDKTELNKSIASAKAALEGRTEDAYTGDDKAVWTALQEKLTAANATAASGDVSQAQVDAAKTALDAAVAAFADTTLGMKIAEAEAAMAGKTETDYEASVWNGLKDAIAAAKAVKASGTATAGEKLAECGKLETAAKNFKPIDKAATDALKAQASAAMEGKDKANYPKAAWEELEAAIAAYEGLPEDASAAEIAAAYNRLQAALANFKPIDKAAADALKAQASAAMEGKDKAKYKSEVWEALEAAIKAYEGLPEDASAEDIAAAYGRLQEALDNFKPIGKADADALKAQASAAMEGKNKADYDEAVWKELEDAIAACGALAADASDEDILAAYNRLQAALGNFQPKGIVKVESVSLSKEALELTVGESETLTATVSPADATNKEVEWKTDDASVASVDASGKVTAAKAGKTTITATSKSDSTKKATCEVTVKEKAAGSVAVTGVKLSKEALELTVGESETLTATVSPANATNKEVEWKTDDASVASVDASGKVTAAKAGKTTITATSKSDSTKKATCEVTVKEKAAESVAVTGVKLSKEALELTAGESETLTATVSPANATNKEVEWKTDDASVATVDANGKVTAVKAGKTTITATSKSDSTKKATCEVTVKEKAGAGPANPTNPGGQTAVKVKSVKLNVKKLTLGLKETYKLTVTVTPKNATDKKVSWKSSNPKVVSVKNGKITAKKTGKAKITVTAGGKTATVTVSVKKAPTKKTKLTLNKKKITLKAKKTFQIKAKVQSKYGSNSFKYTSSKKKVAKVDKNGKVTAVRKGKATITVKSYNGKAKAVLKVTVK